MTSDWEGRSANRRYMAALATFAAVLLGLSVISADLFLTTDSPAEGLADGWVPVNEVPLVIKIGLVGKVEPQKIITLAAPFNGEVHRWLVEQGQRVDEGQVLLQMDPALIDIQMREALAAQLKARRLVGELRDWASGKQVIRARTTLRSAGMALQRSQTRLREDQGLFAQGIIPRNELDDQQQQVGLQEVDLAAATEELRQTLEQGDSELLDIAEMEMANASVKYEALSRLRGQRELVAPFSGVVIPAATLSESGQALSMVFQNGSHVTQGQALFRLADIEHLRVVSSVSELDVNLLREGQAVEVEGDGFEGTLKGVVSAVSGLATPDDDLGNSAIFPITLLLSQPLLAPEPSVRLGMSARLSIVTYRNEHALVVPVSALRRVEGLTTVRYRWAMNQPVEEVAVTTGHSTPDGVEVFGLSAGLVEAL